MVSVALHVNIMGNAVRTGIFNVKNGKIISSCFTDQWYNKPVRHFQEIGVWGER